MSSIQPRSLSNTELIKYSAMFLDSQQGMPIAWQTELLRRFMAADPPENLRDRTPNPDQRELF